jgi:hypothetical protein
MPNPCHSKSHKQMGTCTLVWANICHPEIRMEKAAAAKFHHAGSPSYTKKLTSLAWPTFVFLHPYTVKCTFLSSLHAALVLLLSELHSLPLTLYSKHYYISQPSHLKLCYKTNCSSRQCFLMVLQKLHHTNHKQM